MQSSGISGDTLDLTNASYKSNSVSIGYGEHDFISGRLELRIEQMGVKSRRNVHVTTVLKYTFLI